MADAIERETLDRWIERQYPIAARNMLRSVSATDVVKARPGFGQTIVPARGSVVASPVPASYDPDPDYFFHWYRDSAVVIDALRLLGIAEGPRHFCDFVHFSLGLDRLSGADLVENPGWRAGVAADFRQFVRDEADLSAIEIRGETRVNPDGSLDISRWNRPQHDGIAARALTVLRWAAGAALGAEDREAIDRLLQEDLDFVLAHWREPSFDIWEEEKAHHYYTLRIQGAALEEGAPWLDERGEAAAAQTAREAAGEIRRRLDQYWVQDGGYYRSRLTGDGGPTSKDLDIAVILAVIHAGGDGALHSVRDARVETTLDRLDAVFDADYPINRDRPEDRGPALGRYPGDVYYSGGAYYFSTLGAAEFCFRRARSLKGDDPAAAARLFARGDAYLETIRAYTPADGEMSEQFDKATGAHVSARHLAWSYAAFIGAVKARQAFALGKA
ncbi:glycoside hydrolase family 15 protein [Labrys monachus]|uniref:glucan 1,4-alpha-glucosidase n=1 Tax=Labrys monachus TaxID=217067 RepID=A0ABU0FAM2_9HYPH|nr:glycoside hydrolase family 15 protein [Labrys monachus]MDQ0391169.1 glucoamylase [Labrys monachus]